MIILSASWILVILTVGGGHSHEYLRLDDCIARLKRERVSVTREAFCMTRTRDARMFIKDGKQIAEIR